jgi:hypothetical protein
MWKQAVEKAKSTDTDKVVAAMAGQSFPSPNGFTMKMDNTNHHLWKPVYIGEIQSNGQFKIVWKDPRDSCKRKPWSPYIAVTKARRTLRKRSCRHKGGQPAGASGGEVRNGSVLASGRVGDFLSGPLFGKPSSDSNQHAVRVCVARLVALVWALWRAPRSRCRPTSCATSPLATAKYAARRSARSWRLAIRRRCPLLQALIDGDVQTAGENQVLIVKDDKAIDAATGKEVTPLPETREDVVANNRLRRELATAIAAFKLSSPDRTVRLAAAKELQNSADEEALPAIAAALAKESDPEVKGLLTLTQASIQLASTDRATRLAAVRALAGSDTRCHQDLAAGRRREEGRQVRRARRRDQGRSGSFAVRGRRATAQGRHCRPRLQRHLARHDPAARGAGLAITYG